MVQNCQTFHDYQTGIRLGFLSSKTNYSSLPTKRLPAGRTRLSVVQVQWSTQILSQADADKLVAAKIYCSGIDAGTYNNTTIFSNSNKFLTVWIGISMITTS
jgi:hypothetical protein